MYPKARNGTISCMFIILAITFCRLFCVSGFVIVQQVLENENLSDFGSNLHQFIHKIQIKISTSKFKLSLCHHFNHCGNDSVWEYPLYLWLTKCQLYLGMYARMTSI